GVAPSARPRPCPATAAPRPAAPGADGPGRAPTTRTAGRARPAAGRGLPRTDTGPAGTRRPGNGPSPAGTADPGSSGPAPARAARFGAGRGPWRLTARFGDLPRAHVVRAGAVPLEQVAARLTVAGLVAAMQTETGLVP